MSETVEYWAHTPPTDDPVRPQSMADHTIGVTDRAVRFAAPFQAEELARWAGWLHDIGKYRDEFQRYLRACHRAEMDRTGRTKPPPKGSAEHKCAGTHFALEQLPPGFQDTVALCVMGHHGGLSAASALEDELQNRVEKHGLDLLTVIGRACQELPQLGGPMPSIDGIIAFQRALSA